MLTGQDEITNEQDTIDTRDIIERIKYLDWQDELDKDENLELKRLKEVLAEVGDNSEDSCEDGIILVRYTYFEDYAKDLAYELGVITHDLQWPLNCIDWSEAGDELKQDYQSVNFGIIEYSYR